MISLVGFFVVAVAALGTIVAGKTVVMLGLRHLLKIDSKKKWIKNAKAMKPNNLIDKFNALPLSHDSPSI